MEDIREYWGGLNGLWIKVEVGVVDVTEMDEGLEFWHGDGC